MTDIRFSLYDSLSVNHNIAAVNNAEIFLLHPLVLFSEPRSIIKNPLLNADPLLPRQVISRILSGRFNTGHAGHLSVVCFAAHLKFIEMNFASYLLDTK